MSGCGRMSNAKKCQQLTKMLAEGVVERLVALISVKNGILECQHVLFTQKMLKPPCSSAPSTLCFELPGLQRLPIKPASNALQVMQEVESHWRSGRSLPAQPALTPSHADPTLLETCFCSIQAALAWRQRSVHGALVSPVLLCHAL